MADLRHGAPIAAIPSFGTNIGHFLVGEAIFVGLEGASGVCVT